MIAQLFSSLVEVGWSKGLPTDQGTNPFKAISQGSLISEKIAL